VVYTNTSGTLMVNIDWETENQGGNPYCKSSNFSEVQIIANLFFASSYFIYAI